MLLLDSAFLLIAVGWVAPPLAGFLAGCIRQAGNAGDYDLRSVFLEVSKDIMGSFSISFRLTFNYRFDIASVIRFAVDFSDRFRFRVRVRFRIVYCVRSCIVRCRFRFRFLMAELREYLRGKKWDEGDIDRQSKDRPHIA